MLRKRKKTVDVKTKQQNPEDTRENRRWKRKVEEKRGSWNGGWGVRDRSGGEGAKDSELLLKAFRKIQRTFKKKGFWCLFQKFRPLMCLRTRPNRRRISWTLSGLEMPYFERRNSNLFSPFLSRFLLTPDRLIYLPFVLTSAKQTIKHQTLLAPRSSSIVSTIFCFLSSSDVSCIISLSILV